MVETHAPSTGYLGKVHLNPNVKSEPVFLLGFVDPET